MSVPDLSSLTIPKIKEFAKAKNIKIPSGLKKTDILRFLYGKLYEKDSGIPQNVKFNKDDVDLLIPRVADPNIDWLVHLHTKGWAVVQIKNWNPGFTQLFLQWFERCTRSDGGMSGFDSQDPKTWQSSNMPSMPYGILKHYFGHTELQWSIRELCVEIFASIWQCQPEDLLCSFDGGCFIPTLPKEGNKNTSFKKWIHNDTERSLRSFCCVQGIVNFEDNDLEDGGLVLVEDSHNVFSAYMDKHPSEGISWGPSDINDNLLSSLPLIKICAPAGSIILFDSRTFHCNVQPWGSPYKNNGDPRFRMCTYVSMLPRIGATPQELDKRIRLYQNGRMTGHWCYGPWFKETPEHPQLYGGVNIRPDFIEIAPLNDLRKRLIGYD